MYKEQNGYLIKEPATHKQLFFKTNLFKERTKKFVALLTTEKSKNGYK